MLRYRRIMSLHVPNRFVKQSMLSSLQCLSSLQNAARRHEAPSHPEVKREVTVSDHVLLHAVGTAVEVVRLDLVMAGALWRQWLKAAL